MAVVSEVVGLAGVGELNKLGWAGDGKPDSIDGAGHERACAAGDVRVVDGIGVCCGARCQRKCDESRAQETKTIHWNLDAGRIHNLYPNHTRNF